MTAPLSVSARTPAPAGPLPRRLVSLALTLVLVLGAGWLIWDNRRLLTTHYEISIDGLAGVRIAQVSDLHASDFGSFPERLLGEVAASQPDLIAVTGDLIDVGTTDLAGVLGVAERLEAIAPTYVVLGNHEADSPRRDELLHGLREAGVTVLRDEAQVVEVAGRVLTLIGIDDPRVARADGRRPLTAPEQVEQATSETDDVADAQAAFGSPAGTVLLAHRPELFEQYTGHGIDLVLSGHAHGGQVRLPVVGGLYAPHQGWFPGLSEGVHSSGATTLVVSRGLGNSVAGVRVNNPRELVIIDVI